VDVPKDYCAELHLNIKHKSYKRQALFWYLCAVTPCEITGRSKALLIQNSSHRYFGKTARRQVTYPKKEILNVTEYILNYFIRSIYSLSTTFFLQAKLGRWFQNFSNNWVTWLQNIANPLPTC